MRRVAGGEKGYYACAKYLKNRPKAEQTRMVGRAVAKDLELRRPG